MKTWQEILILIGCAMTLIGVSFGGRIYRWEMIVFPIVVATLIIMRMVEGRNDGG
jgi:Ca2+/Na+ antiporter